MAEHIIIGTRFDSLTKLEQAVKTYEKQHLVQLYKRHTRSIQKYAERVKSRNLMEIANKNLVNAEMDFACIHGGKPNFKSRGKGIRPSRQSFQVNCPVHMKFRLTTDAQFLEVRALEDAHNHPLCKTSPDMMNDDSKEGLPGAEERGGGEFGQGGEEVPVSLSPEQFLSEASEREPTPAPPTPTPPKPESYQLRHNNHLTIVLEALARDEAFMDVTLTAQGRSLKAHKSVLSAVSPYFRGVLRDNPCQHPIIIMPRDVRFEELYSIVNYIYKGEMTVAAEDLTSLLKTAEILQVSGLAPSDSTATVNPSTESCATGNVRSSSASSSSSSSTHQAGARTVRASKPTPQGVATPPARPKSRDCMINPTDFMDVDMTCVKEEVASGGEEEEESANNEAAPPPPANENGKQDETQETRNGSPTIEHVQETTPAVPVSQVQEPTTTAATPNIKSEPGGSVDHPPASTVPEDPVPFMCPHCQEIHRSNEMIMSHLRLKHPSKPSFVCGCGRVFVRQLQHQAHTRVCSSSS